MVVAESIVAESQILTFRSDKFDYPELQISINFLQVVATEVVLFIVKHPLKFVGIRLAHKCLKAMSPK